MDRFRVALTIDAELPDKHANVVGQEELLLDRLWDAGAKATFFVQGRWAEAFPRQARRIADHGHLVGSHSYYHARMWLLTDEGIREDLRTAEQTIKRICEHDPAPWFRSPFGQGARDPRVRAALAELGYRQCLWTASAHDWDPYRDPSTLEDELVDQAIAQGDGAILLVHSWPLNTHATLASILRRLGEAGAEFVTLDQLDPEQIPDHWSDPAEA